MSQKVSIALMMNTFLYLPIYVAEDLKLFKKFIPSNYRLELDRQPHEASDLEVFRQVMGDRRGEECVWFGICDPMPVYQEGAQPSHHRYGKVVATLINKASFWAVDRDVNIFHTEELPKRFKVIIAYGEGTTSYALANFIAAQKPSSETPIEIRPVLPGHEFEDLLRSDPDVVAITPDLLTAIAYSEDRESNLNICYPFSGEFSNLLMTALITREDIIQNHPHLVKGVLQALQHAIILIKMENPKVINVASKAFKRHHKKIIEEKTIKKALDRALREDLFPTDIRVERSSWYNAVQVYHKSKNLPPPESKTLEDTFKEYVDLKPAQLVNMEHTFPRIIGESQKSLLEYATYFTPLALALMMIISSSYFTNNISHILLRYLGTFYLFLFFWFWVRDSMRVSRLHLIWWILYWLSWLTLFILMTVGYDVVADNDLFKPYANSVWLQQLKSSFITLLVGAFSLIFVVIQVAGLKNPSDES